jgi:hypothetical protein
MDGQKDNMKTENKTQQEIIMYYRNNYCLKHHNPKHAIFSVPNDSKDAKEQMRKIATGLMRGVSDLIIVKPNEVVFCEVKTDVGRQSDSQKEFEQTVSNLGFRYILVRSLEDFKKQISK